MRRTVKVLGALGLVVVFGACSAGRNFKEPTEESLVLGTTTMAEIRERFGKPQNEGTSNKDGHNMQVLTYAYARQGGAHASGVTPARAMALTFSDDHLVGYSFASSFEEDHTDYDESKLAQIQQGVTKRPEVLSLLGPTRGKCIYPLAATVGQEAIVYAYTQYRKGMFKVAIFRKTAVITFDGSDVVTHVESSASGEK